MKVSLRNQTPNQHLGFFRGLFPQGLFALLLVLSLKDPTWAEGSKDFINYPGRRMYLDTRDPQQLKVYANVGEFINVGASHLGFPNGTGYIRVYRPDGTLATSFNDQAGNTGLGIIQNITQEIAGPTGGGTTNGAGYIPGVVQVPSGQAGIWTVVFDFEDAYLPGIFTPILNNAPWTRVANQQPVNRKAILAWDITITSGGAGNTGGTVHEGRVYTNEHVSILGNNSFTTSPVFYVLTNDGYQYQVNINDADPFRFPISSNSLGLVKGNGDPIYKSKPENLFTRSADPTGWNPNDFYLFEPQAADDPTLGLVNNKIFFNQPDPTMPQNATVTDVFRSNTHNTWLYRGLQGLNVSSTSIIGNNANGEPCSPGVFQFGKGGFFVFNTNIGGSITLQLDLNNNGIFNDPVDVTLISVLNDGIDSVFWNGSDGLGIPVPVQTNFTFNYHATLRFGELHIALTDVEANTGGVQFTWLNAPSGSPNDLFYYDHTDVGGPVSGGGTAGNALPTTIPYTYPLPDGNEKYLDQWFFIDQQLDSTVTITIAVECVCENTSPILTGAGQDTLCAGQNLALSATNTATGIGNLTYVWSGPSNFAFTQPNMPENATSNININNLTTSNAGTYQVIATTVVGCADTLTYNVAINAVPEINAISPNGTFCEGSSVTLTAQNNVLGTGLLDYVWIGPNNDTIFVGNDAPELGPFEAIINNLTASDAGSYTLILTTDLGCQSVPQSVTIAVDPAPIINIANIGDLCVGQDAVLSATNAGNGGAFECVWTAPNGNLIGLGQATGTQACEVQLNDLQIADTGVYTITITYLSTGCSASSSINLNILPGLNIEDETPDSTYCEFQTIVLTANNTVAAGELTYTWFGPNGKVLGPLIAASNEPLVAIIDEAEPDCTGTWTLDVTSELGCSSNDVTVEVTVLPGVQITTVSGGGDYCFDAPITLSGTGVGTADSVVYTWSAPDATILGSGTTTPAGPFTTTAIANQTGAYILEVVAANGCSDTETVDANYNALPEVQIVNNDTTLCSLDTLELCGQALTVNMGDFTYIWTTPTGQTIPGSANGNDPFCEVILPLQTYGEGPYVLVITANGCTSLPDTFNVNLNPNPVISIISGGGTFCETDTAQVCFTNTNPEVVGFFYTCIFPDGTLTSGQTNTNEIICLDATQEGVYCCSIESLDGCVSSLACVTVNYEPSADLDATATNQICANDTLILFGVNNLPCTGTFTYAWNGPNGFTFVGTSPCGGNFDAIVPNPVSGEYCLIAPLNSNCPDTVCVTVVVNPVPQVVQNTITGGGTFCAGDAGELTATVTISDNTPITYTWCRNDVPIPGQTGTVPSGTTVTLDLGQLEVTETGEYCLKLVSSNGCLNIPPTCTTITVNPSPEILSTTGGGVYCEGVSVSLNGTGTPGLAQVTYTWTDEDGNVIFTGSAPSAGPFPATIPDITEQQEGTYTLTVTLGDCNDTQTVVVEVNPKPIITVINGNETVCAGSTVTATFSIDLNGATSVDWNFDSSVLTESGTVFNDTIITFDVTVTTTTTITITAESSDGCEAEPQQIVITVQDIETPILTPSATIICPGEALVLTTQPYTGNTVTYEWFVDGVSQGTTTVPTFTLDPPVSGSYTVTVTVDGCSATSNPIGITVPPTPEAEDDNFESETLSPVNGNVSSNDNPNAGVVITVVEEPTTGTLDLNEDGSFTYTPDENTGSTVTFTYESCLVDCPDACDQALVTILFNVDCTVPNVLTPNGDNFNDVLEIECLNNNSYPNNRLRVFNRWGDEIRSYEPYINDEGWDCTYGSDKKEVPAATYFYLLELDKNGGSGDDNVLSGYIKVVR